MWSLHKILEKSASRHSHLCPRQVLGVRIGLAGAQAVGLEPPVRTDRWLVILETDGCFADGIEAATGCSVGHRTLRIEDYGKIAATFVDIRHGRAVRVDPISWMRENEQRPMLLRNRAITLLNSLPIRRCRMQNCFPSRKCALNIPIQALVGRPGVRVNCDMCGEEIINGREVIIEEMTLCQACAGGLIIRHKRRTSRSPSR